MNYTVVWRPAAERELTTIWLASRMRHLIRAVADQLDRQLAADPKNIGESREGNRRIVVMLPLVVEFEVNDDDRTVYVHAVRES